MNAPSLHRNCSKRIFTVLIAGLVLAGIKPGLWSQEVSTRCRLLEMTSQQADRVETKLLRWSVAPWTLTKELDDVLWGGSARVLADLQGVSAPGRRGWIKHADANLEYEIAVGPSGRNADVIFAFNQSSSRGAMKVNASTISQVLAHSSVPVLASRWDHGGMARLLMLRFAWGPLPSPNDAVPAVTSFCLRALAYSVPGAQSAEADRLRNQPDELSTLLRSRGKLLAIFAASSKSGMRLRFLDVEGKPEIRSKGRFQTGFEMEATPVLMAQTASAELEMRLRFSLPRSSQTGVLAEREFTAALPQNMAVPHGKSLAFACNEEGVASGKGQVFVVIQPLWPRTVQ